MFDTDYTTYLIETECGRSAAFPVSVLPGQDVHSPEAYRKALKEYEQVTGYRVSAVGRARSDGGPPHLFARNQIILRCKTLA